jgi:G3E family GTPase
MSSSSIAFSRRFFLQIVTQVCALEDSGRFDYIIIESTGISEPLQVRRRLPLLLACVVNSSLQVAETFSFVDERDGSALIDHAFLDTMVARRVGNRPLLCVT